MRTNSSLVSGGTRLAIFSYRESVVSGSDIVSVRVKPGSRKGPMVEVGVDTDLTIYVPERAVDGKANAAVSRLLAQHLGVPQARVKLVAGARARLKRFRVLR
ncbi:DUF167 domain-containing protein [Mycobacterium lacus]|nr:DUF167 domain-containing protein [Mycobacterium lacus]